MCQIIFKSINKYGSYSPDKSARTDVQTDAGTYAKVPLWQLILTQCKRASQKGFRTIYKTQTEVFKKVLSF